MPEETRDTPRAAHEHNAPKVAQTSQNAALSSYHAPRGSGSMPEHHPGDYILDRYLPDASEALREEARENLRRLVDFIIRVNERLAADNPQPKIRASEESALESESPPLHV